MRVLLLILLLSVRAMAAPTAVASVKVEPWVQSYFELGRYAPYSMTQGLAPFAVFLEGWESTAETGRTIESWVWNFGDGSPTRDGFCMAHVYETPGVYTATLTVTDSLGAQDTDSVTITVLSRTPYTTYYVDSDNGNDENNGLTPETAWRTATKAFNLTNLTSCCTVEFLGDRVLPYDLDTEIFISGYGKPGILWKASPGFTNKPVIRRWENPAKSVTQYNAYHIRWSNRLGFYTVQDLVFSELTGNGNFGTAHEVLGVLVNLLFLRVEVIDAYQAFTFNINVPASSDNTSGAFVVGCKASNPVTAGTPLNGKYGNTQTYFHCKRVACIGNEFDLSGNHIVYGSWFQGAVFIDNVLSRPAFGRAALRISGAGGSFDNPTLNVWVDNNQLLGWIDPVNDPSSAHNGGGTRYNIHLASIATQTPTNQIIRNVRWQNNLVTNFETALSVANTENAIIQGNTFISPSTYPGPRIQIGGDYERASNKNIVIRNNSIEVPGARTSPYEDGIFVIRDYNPVNNYAGRTVHEEIFFLNNTVNIQTGLGPLVWFKAYNAGQIEQVRHKNNLLFAGAPLDRGAGRMVKIGGDNINSVQPYATYSIDEWYNITGNEAVDAPPPPPPPPPDPEPQPTSGKAPFRKEM